MRQRGGEQARAWLTQLEAMAADESVTAARGSSVWRWRRMGETARETVRQAVADREREAAEVLSVIAGIPHDRRRMEAMGRPVPAPVPDSTYEQVACETCSQPCWISPSQVASRTLNGFPVQCFYCALVTIRGADWHIEEA
jgi:hypothetical protein